MEVDWEEEICFLLEVSEVCQCLMSMKMPLITLWWELTVRKVLHQDIGSRQRL